MAPPASSPVPPECAGYIRQPSIAGSHVAFVAEDAVWVVDRAGGRPRRITNVPGATRCPLFCPSGERLAFSAGRDVWAMGLRDLRPRRLTWFSGGYARAVAWAPVASGAEPELIVASEANEAMGRKRLYVVPLSGGQPRLLLQGEYDTVVYEPGGKGMCIGRHTVDKDAYGTWKGYRGGRHGFVWIDKEGSRNFRRLPLNESGFDAGSDRPMNVSCLMWLRGRLWFVADPDGSGNLWSCDLEGKDCTKHTDHDLFDVRGASSAEDVIAYVCGGDLWVLDLAAGEHRRLELDFGWPSSHVPQFLDAEDNCEAVLLHPDGHHFACLSRGQVFESALWSGPPVALRPPLSPGEPAGERAIRCVAMEYMFSGRLVTITDERWPVPSFTIHPSAPLSGDMKPTKASEWIGMLLADSGHGAQRILADRPLGNIREMVASPAHDALLLVTGRNELLLAEFAPEVGERPSPEKEPAVNLDVPLRLCIKMLDKGVWEEGIAEPVWSPDAQWIAYVRKDSRRGASVVLLKLATGEKTVVADSSFVNFTPGFDPSGRFLSFFSSRTFAPLEDGVTFDLTFATGSDLPYLALLQKDAVNPFKRPALSPAEIRDQQDGNGDDEDEGEEEEEAEDDDGDEDAEEAEHEPPKPVEIDVEGLADRILQFPLPFGRYSCGAWTESGKFMYLRGHSLAQQPTADGDNEEDHKKALFAYNFLRLKEEKLGENVEDYHLSMDLRNVLVEIKEKDSEDGEYYRVHVAGEKLPGEGDDDDDVDLDTPGPESGLLDISSRISLEVVPAREWAQVFEETCHHVQENFFDEQVGGVGWADMCKRYRELLPRLRCRSELTDLISELLAEVGVSHMSAGDPEGEEGEEGPSGGSPATLGAKVSWHELAGSGAYRVDALTKGDTWDSRFSGPLARPGVGVVEGSYIIAVNRVRVCREVSLEQMLADMSGAEVFVTVVPPENAQRFAQVQGLLHKHGGMDGFRRMTAEQRKALEGNRAQDGKKKKKKKNKEAKKAAAKNAQAETEKKFAAMLSNIGVNVDDGPIWRTVRVSVGNYSTQANATLRDGVEESLRHVNEVTKGRVGYIFVPDSAELGFAEFHRYFGRECHREALIVDLRCNQGGYISEMCLKQLKNAPLGWSVARPGRNGLAVCPELCPPATLVLLIDENTSSDGECWTQAIKQFGLGKVVGVRSWGGVCDVGGGNLDTIDGGFVDIPYQHYYMAGGVGFGLENYGVEPDVVVEWPPRLGAGFGPEEDPQLCEAIKLAEAMLAERGAQAEVPTKFPATRLHRQGPRRPALGPAAGTPASQ